MWIGLWNATGTTLVIRGNGGTLYTIDLTNASYDTLAELRTYINTLTNFSVGAQSGGYLSNGLKTATTALPIGVATAIPLDDDTTANNRLYKEEITNSIADLETALHEDAGCAAYTVKTFAFPYSTSVTSVLTWIVANTSLTGIDGLRDYGEHLQHINRQFSLISIFYISQVF